MRLSVSLEVGSCDSLHDAHSLQPIESLLCGPLSETVGLFHARAGKMADMKNDRKESGGGCAVLVVVGLAMLPILYILGIGPAYWLTIHGFLSEEIANGFYYPLNYLGERSQLFHDSVEWYLSFW